MYRVPEWTGVGEDHGEQKVAELAAQYGGGALAPDEQVFAERYGRLTAADRTRAHALLMRWLPRAVMLRR